MSSRERSSNGLLLDPSKPFLSPSSLYFPRFFFLSHTHALSLTVSHSYLLTPTLAPPSSTPLCIPSRAGNWSDKSPLWQQYPKVARAVDFKATDDGTFWMEFKDFCQFYKVAEWGGQGYGMADGCVCVCV